MSIVDTEVRFDIEEISFYNSVLHVFPWNFWPMEIVGPKLDYFLCRNRKVSFDTGRNRHHRVLWEIWEKKVNYILNYLKEKLRGNYFFVCAQKSCLFSLFLIIIILDMLWWKLPKRREKFRKEKGWNNRNELVVMSTVTLKKENLIRI